MKKRVKISASISGNCLNTKISPEKHSGETILSKKDQTLYSGFG